MKKHFLLAIVVVFNLSLLSQDKSSTTTQPTIFYTNSTTGNTNDAVLTTVQPVQKSDPEREALLRQLHEARLNNNLTEASRLQNLLDGGRSTHSNFVNDPQKTGMLITEGSGSYNHPPFHEPEYHVSTIAGGAFWAVATATSHRSTAIFAAVTSFANGAADTLKIYVSYNGGATWVLKNTFSAWASSVDYRNGELDIEPVISGSDTLLFCVAGYTFNNHALVHIYRVNIGTGTFQSTVFDFGGYAQTNVNYYNPKVTSDNTIYASGSYVYILASFDSASTVRYSSRYCVILNPFAGTFTLTHRMPNPPSGFWWQSNGLPTYTYLWTDICYYNAGSVNRIYTTYNHAGSATDTRIYLAWSDDYGISNAGSAIYSDVNLVRNAVCASNGGSGQQNVALGYRYFFNPDWDYRLAHSTNGGTTSGAFTTSTIEGTTDTTLTVSLQGIDLGAGRFVTAHSRNGGEHFYRTFNNGTLGTSLQTNNITGATTFGAVQAGYWSSSNPDSCLVVWSGGNGTNVYCSRLVCSTVGLEPISGSIPVLYSLEQNYPNPFNPVTTIKFNIPKSGVVKLSVYDMMGREVTTLVNQELLAGRYSVDFNALSLASGVYFYKLQAGEFTDTKKMMLIK
jgi:hypothetical protein